MAAGLPKVIGIVSLLFIAGLAGCGPKPIVNEPPVALFTLDWLDNFALELDASLSYDSDGQIILYEWGFGDGAKVTSPFPSTYHRYQAGNYLITLKVTDEKGSSTSLARDIVVVPEKTLSLATLIKERGGTTLGNWPPLELVIRTQTEWERVLQYFPHPPTLLAIDFAEEIAILVGLGERNNANDSVQITKLIAAGGKLTVYYQELIPDPRCPILPTFSYPFHIVKTERVDLPAVFLKEVVINPNCY